MDRRCRKVLQGTVPALQRLGHRRNTGTLGNVKIRVGNKSTIDSRAVGVRSPYHGFSGVPNASAETVLHLSPLWLTGHKKRRGVQQH